MKHPDLYRRLVALDAVLDQVELGRKFNPATGQWEETDVDPIGNHPLTTAAVGAGGVGAGLGHGYVMKNYGGGGVKEAYRNVGRNVARAAGENAHTATPFVQDALGVVKSEAGLLGSKAKTGLAEILKKLRGKASPLLARVGLEENLRGRLVALEAHVDEAVELGFMVDGKPVEKNRISYRPRRLRDENDVHHPTRNGKVAAAGLSGLAIGSAAKTLYDAGGPEGMLRKMRAARNLATTSAKAGYRARGAVEQLRKVGSRLRK